MTDKNKIHCQDCLGEAVYNTLIGHGLAELILIINLLRQYKCPVYCCQDSLEKYVQIIPLRAQANVCS